MQNLKALKSSSFNSLVTLTTFSLLILYPASLAASHTCFQSANYSGVFIGIAGGGIQGNAKYLRYRQGGAFGNIPTRDSITGSGWIVGGQAYASQTYCKIYNFGLEVWTNRAFVDLLTNDKIFFKESLKYKIKHSIGIAGKLGIVTGPALFYIKPGIVFSKRDIFSKFSAIYNADGSSIPSHRSKGYMRGFSFGIGADVAIPNSQFTIGSEAIITRYRRFNYRHPMPSGIPGDIKIRFKPKTFTFLVKLNYKLHSF